MSDMISRLLIANRGEIACRIARTAHRMGIATVGVYADPDATALHTDAVDVAVALGGATPAESYLRGDAIIAAAIAHGADAVHPGYGFLAENAEFAQAVIDAGLMWVGPTPDQIRLLGDKVAAKRTALDAGVPTTPIVEVSPGDVAADVPMPALVKAAAGGGGRGMRVVTDPADLPDAVAAAAREAEAAFGDGTVFVEPWIADGRHVEVQILGDSHGTVIHLGERECSIQRRNQKIVEESPSAGIDDRTRVALTDGALALADHVGYRNAGTVEFLVAADGTITFLEVNTRLQVEHPVTEAVTGLDLVELQLRVAAGEPLPVGQDDVVIEGHAIEVRLVAEDPAAGWLPSTGTIGRLDLTTADVDGIRVDTGFGDGSEVSADYDSLLAKVIAHGPDRGIAAGRLRRALRRATVAGVRTNLDTLTAITAEPDFLAAHTPTSYLDDHPDVVRPEPDEAVGRMAVVAATLAVEARNRDADPVTGFAPSGWRNLRTSGQRRAWLDADQVHEVEYVMHDRAATVLLGSPDGDRQELSVRLLRRWDGESITVEIDGVRHTATVGLDGDRAHVTSPIGGRSLTLAPRFVTPDHEETGAGPVCPLPGTVIAVHVTTGDTVTEGTVLMIVEAMKMEHKIAAGADAVVAEVLFGVGERVDTGDLLVRLEDPA